MTSLAAPLPKEALVRLEEEVVEEEEDCNNVSKGEGWMRGGLRNMGAS